MSAEFLVYSLDYQYFKYLGTINYPLNKYTNNPLIINNLLFTYPQLIVKNIFYYKVQKILPS